ncbi:hypothetical protein ACE3MQ_25235 [Paenibacillus lentus]|uniref:hypothetical protein n=1 Tax=Paenibacillus lentus TaxID=1338368 RepID=UPI00365DE8CB
MLIKTSNYHDFLELVVSVKNTTDDQGIILYSRNEVDPPISFSNNDTGKQLLISLLFCSATMDVYFVKRFTIKEFSSIKLNPDTSVSAIDVHGDI